MYSSPPCGCQANAADWLPYGFAVTNYVPLTAVQTPLKFAGLTCASCHIGHVRGPSGDVLELVGGTNTEFGFLRYMARLVETVNDERFNAVNFERATCSEL